MPDQLPIAERIATAQKSPYDESTNAILLLAEAQLQTAKAVERVADMLEMIPTTLIDNASLVLMEAAARVRQ